MMPAANNGSRFKIEPNPPVAGERATVTYVGPAREVEWQVDGQDPVSVKPNDNGKFVIDPVPDGIELWLSDNLGLPGHLHSNIVLVDGGPEGK